MADVKISALPAATAATAMDIPGVEAGVTKKRAMTATGAALVEAANSAAVRTVAGITGANPINGTLACHQGFWDFWDFGPAAVAPPWAPANNSGGSTNTNVTPGTGDGERWGSLQMRTNTTASVDQRGGMATGLTQGYPGNGTEWHTCCAICPRSNFDGTNTGRWWFGTSDTISSYGNGAYGFRSEDGGNFFAFSRNGGAETATDTGIASTIGTWRDLYIIYRSGGSQIEFYIDKVLVATHTTNINVTTNRFGFLVCIHRTAATAVGISWDIDYFGIGGKKATQEVLQGFAS